MSDSARKEIHEYIVTAALGGDSRGLTDDTDLQEAGLLDSLTTLGLVAFLEERFEIRLDPPDINPDAFRTTATIARLVETKTPTER